jgi:hypothetical protein
LDPPPAARQKTFEMHDTEVNPPTGGRAVRGRDHPAAGTTGVATVVGTAEGRVVVGALVVVGADRGAVELVGLTWRTGADDEPAHAAPTSARTRAAPTAARLCTTTNPSVRLRPPGADGTG